MADYTIDHDQVGVYEVPLTAGEATTVRLAGEGQLIFGTLQVTVHAADAPVYARRGDTVEVKDPRAVVVPVGTWVDVATSPKSNSTIALISAAAAVVSVARA